MKKFLEALKQASINTYDIAPNDSKAKERYKEIMNNYRHLEGRTVLYTSKVNKESRVVVVESVGPRFITVTYPYYGAVSGTIRTTITYGSLLSGDEVLEDEQA